MKKVFGRISAIVLALVLALGGLYAPEPVSAGQKTYYGSPKIEEYKAISSFYEGGIKYLVTERPYSGNNGKAYVGGGDFRQETISIPAVVTHNSSKYDVVGINDMAFLNYENLIKVTIADGPTYIGGGAFWGCWYLESITLPKTLKELGKSALAYCGSLKNITFPDSLTVIPPSVCENSGVSKVSFGSKVTEIGSGAFSECMDLKEITLPSSLKTLGGHAFLRCRNLKKVNNKSKIKEADFGTAFAQTKWESDRKEQTGSFTYGEKDMLISVYLDNKQLKDGWLYYRMDDYYAELRGLEYDDWEHGACAQLKKDSDGNFIFDKNFISSGMYPVSGNFYYCETKPKDFIKDCTLKFAVSDIPSIGDMGDERNEDDPRPIRLFTVHYAQGEYEAYGLPEDQIVSKYGYGSIGGLSFPKSPGRALAYYADSDGKRVDYIRDLDGPVTLHPVFVNEDELYKGENYLSEAKNPYSTFMRSRANWSELAENVNIKKGTELIKRFLLETNEKEGVCLVTGKVTVSDKDLEKIRKTMSEEDQNRHVMRAGSNFLSNKKEYILIKDGGVLTIDGLHIANAFTISLQKGAKLRLINDTSIKGITISIQEGAEVEIIDATMTGEIMNSGKIVVKTPDFLRSSDSFDRVSLAAGHFFNSKMGVIELGYGALKWGNDFDVDYGPGSVKSDMRDDSDAIVINNGTINVTGYGHITMDDGFQNREHKVSFAKNPVVNNGTINITSSAKKSYRNPMFQFKHNSFYNYGTVKLSSDVKRSSRFAGSYGARAAEWENSFEADIQILESEFINYGTIDIDVKNGVGMTVLESLFPRDRVIKRFEEDGDTSSHGRLENRKGGKINITTDNGTGLVIGRNAYLINNGTVTINEKDANSKEPSLVVGGKVINNSKITNNGSIGYTTTCMYSELKAYALDNGYSGKKWSGSGRELLAYMLELRGPEHYKDFNLYVTGGKKVYCDGKSEVRDDHEDEAGLSCETVFLPVNAKTKLTVKVSGFADKTVEFTSAASVKDYYDTAYKRLKSGAEPNNYINISLTKGKGTADSSVTARPLDIDEQIIVGDAFYTVITADLKGGTVCFEHGGTVNNALIIPDTVTYEGRTYKVTMVRYCGSSVESVTVGKNVEYLCSNSFRYSSSLKTVNIKTERLKTGSVGKYAFEQMPQSCVITVPEKKLKGYKKIFKAVGINKKIKIKGK